jgi:phosphopantothenoylcysteine decarboxylase/phosphopantothenate--cysteine ligase
MLLTNKKILLGITGSIAAYKSILLLRLLIKEGAEVRVVMTPASKDFVSPLVLSVLSKNKVIIEWHGEYEWNNHVDLGRWADLFVIAPLTCNTLSKMVHGGCDNVLLASYLSAICPVLVVPAMDEDMWHNRATQKNMALLNEYGVNSLKVRSGELASGLHGQGRMAEPEEIFTHIVETFFRGTTLQGKKVLVTAGPTYEPLDPVRYIGNRSSGKMGFALAEAFYMQGAEVLLVSGPSKEETRFQGVKVSRVGTAEEMFEACLVNQDADIVVMSAAVADYRPASASEQKIKKTGEELSLELIKNKDILGYFGEHKKSGHMLVGFALETENEKENAFQKLRKKHLDLIVLNSLNDIGAGFEKDTNKVSLIHAKGIVELPLQSKKELAGEIVSYLINKMNLL